MSTKAMDTSRQAQLLEFIIREYTKKAEPVGSALVTEKAGFDVSSATVRNDMADLEQAGYLMQPHTSAGRVPTDKAYRWFVDNILITGNYQLDPKYKRKIEQTLQEAGRDPKEINKKLAQVLSELTENLVITNIEKQDDMIYKTGLSSLFGSPEFREFDRMFQMTNFFDQFDRMFQEIERMCLRDLHGDTGFNIFIGRENPFPSIKDETTIHAKYPLPQRYKGTLTIVGPTRMDYQKNIGLVAYATQVLENLAN